MSAVRTKTALAAVIVGVCGWSLASSRSQHVLRISDIDLGEVYVSSNITFSLLIQNKSWTPVTISNLVSSCRCTRIDLVERTIPGKCEALCSGALDLTDIFDSGEHESKPFIIRVRIEATVNGKRIFRDVKVFGTAVRQIAHQTDFRGLFFDPIQTKADGRPLHVVALDLLVPIKSLDVKFATHDAEIDIPFYLEITRQNRSLAHINLYGMNSGRSGKCRGLVQVIADGEVACVIPLEIDVAGMASVVPRSIRLRDSVNSFRLQIHAKGEFDVSHVDIPGGGSVLIEGGASPHTKQITIHFAQMPSATTEVKMTVDLRNGLTEILRLPVFVD